MEGQKPQDSDSKIASNSGDHSVVHILDLLTLKRPIIFFDTETTGPNPREDRIVELAFIKLTPEPGEMKTRRWSSFLNPEIPIPKQATFGEGDYPGHGITNEKVTGAPTFAGIAASLLKGFHACDYGGYNIKAFDLPLLQSEFNRAGHAWSYADAKILDGLRIWQIGQRRTLSDAVEVFLQRKHEGAHRALDDVQATLDIITAQLETFKALPRSLEQLHDLQFPKAANAIDSEGKVVWVDDEIVFNFGKKWRGVPLKKMERNALKWIADPNQCKQVDDVVRRICREALAGRFLTRRDFPNV